MPTTRLPFLISNPVTYITNSSEVPVGELVAPARVVGFFAGSHAPILVAADVYELRDAPDAGGTLLGTLTLPIGSQEARLALDVSLPAGTVLYVRPETSINGTETSGYVEIESAVDSGATTFLTTLARVKEAENIPTANTNSDARLNLLIAGVSTAMQNYLGRSIVDTSRIEKRSGDVFTDSIDLPHWPITPTVTPVVEILDATGAVSEMLADGTDFEIDIDSGVLYRLGATAWTPGHRNIQVTYSSGYVSVPTDLAMAADEEVRHRFAQDRAQGNRIGLTGKQGEQGQGEDFVSGVAFLTMTKTILDNYRARGF